jgi:tRNA A-37 threonylcarbamoyl transferase component Bud32
MDDGSRRGDGDDARRPDAPVDEWSETVFEDAPFEPSAGPVEAAGTAARYRLGPAIGEGGMAVVYEAQDTVLDRPVAVKTLRTEHAGNEGHRSRFAAEVRVMAALDHPGAVPVYEAGVLPGGEHFYAMKRVRGRTLRDLLAARTPGDVASRHSLAHFVDIFERVCQTVAAAHATGVIHRDLKPENVMVDELGVVYVMDWGLAKRLQPVRAPGDETRTQLGEVMGTPAYMSPEQARGEAAGSGRETDVFSLGIMLYEILTGRRPFRGADYRETMQKIVYEDAPDPRRLNRRAGRDLAAVCMRALEKNPVRRYRDAGELAEDIRRYREFLAVSAVRPRVIDRVTSWARRRPGLAAALATLLAGGLLVGAWVGMQAAARRALLVAGLAEIGEHRATLERVEAELTTVDQKLDAGRLSVDDRVGLETERAELRAQRQATNERMRAMFSALLGLTIGAPDPEVQREARDHMLMVVQRRLVETDPFRAKATIEWLLEGASRRNPLGFDRHQREQLQAALAQADAAIMAWQVQLRDRLPEQARPAAGAAR